MSVHPREMTRRDLRSLRGNPLSMRLGLDSVKKYIGSCALILAFLLPGSACLGQSNSEGDQSFRILNEADVPSPADLLKQLDQLPGVDVDSRLSPLMDDDFRDWVQNELLPNLSEEDRDALTELAQDVLQQQSGESQSSFDMDSAADALRQELSQNPELEDRLRETLEQRPGGNNALSEFMQRPPTNGAELDPTRGGVEPSGAGGNQTPGLSGDNRQNGSRPLTNENQGSTNNGQPVGPQPPTGTEGGNGVNPGDDPNSNGTGIQRGNGIQSGDLEQPNAQGAGNARRPGASPNRPQREGDPSSVGEQNNDPSRRNDPNREPLGNSNSDPSNREPNRDRQNPTNQNGNQTPRSNPNRPNPNRPNPNRPDPNRAGANGSDRNESDSPSRRRRPNPNEKFRDRFNRILMDAAERSVTGEGESDGSPGGRNSQFNELLSGIAEGVQDRMKDRETRGRMRDNWNRIRNEGRSRVGGTGLPTQPDVGGTPDVSGANLSPSTMAGIVIVVITGGVIFYLTRNWQKNMATAVSKYARAMAHANSLRVSAIESGPDLVTAVDRFVFWRYGQGSHWWHGGVVKRELIANHPHLQTQIGEMLSAYETVRYAPAAQPLPQDRLQRSSGTLQQLMDVSKSEDGLRQVIDQIDRDV